MIDKIKVALRIDDDDLNDEIQDLIDACLLDLKISGVVRYKEDDKLILRAVITYCRAHFDMGSANFEKLCACYDSLKTHLSLCAEYMGVDEA